MCDTLVALPDFTARGALLFAKNSDRERNEAQLIEMTPRRRRDGSGQVALTYLTIPDVEETHACLLSRPFWMWGAEMGANEHGVVIGNEALHARTPAQRRQALTGMDLLRLALERADSARAAVEVIIALLEQYGQGGNCGHLGRFYYNNGFIVADRAEAYVLETAGRWWAVERVTGTRSLSNAYSIGREPDAISPALVAHAREQGWCDADGRFDVAERLIDPVRDAVSFGRGRCARGQTLLDRGGRQLDPAAMKAILRDHGEAEDWSPANTVGRTLCMHAAEGPRRSQSVASMVSEIRPGRAIHWVTATSAPCTSIFKPVLLEAGPPPVGPEPSDQFDSESLWWRHERLHRTMLRDFNAGLAAIVTERDALEASFRARVDAALERGDSRESLQELIEACWREAAGVESVWAMALGSPASRNPPAYARSWARLNQAGGFPRVGPERGWSRP